MVRRLSAAVAASLTVLWASCLYAATVMVVRPASPSPELSETVARLNGELLAVGLVVVVVDRGQPSGASGQSAHAWLESVATQRRIDAAIDVIGGEQLEGADIWVFPAAPRPPKAARATAERGVQNAPARLALRATDVLRSLLIENDLDGPPRRALDAPPARTAPAIETTARASADVARVGVELGAALMTSLDGVGPALLPVIRIGASVTPRLELQAELAGLGTRPTVGGPGSSARVAQQYAVVGACLCTPAASGWRPILSLSIGALHSAADGQADPPLQAHAVSRWSFLAQASAGLRVRLGGRFALTIAAHVQLADPYVEIRVVNPGTATAGRPNLLLSTAVGAWL